MKDEETKPHASESEDDTETIPTNPEHTEQDEKDEVDYGEKMNSYLKKRIDKRFQRR